MKNTGKKNILFGFIYLITTVALGLFLAKKLGSQDPQWFDSMTRALLKTAHVHGNLESVLNIVIGLVLYHYGNSQRTLARAASVLAITGAVFHSGMLYLGGLGIQFAMKLTPVGAISLLAAIAVMAVVVFKSDE